MTPASGRHYHINYTDSELGQGAMAMADGHTHDLVFNPARPARPATPAVPPQIDPNTGQPAIDPNTGQPDQGQPADPGDPGNPVSSWTVRPGGTDMHTHELQDYPPASVKKLTQEEKDEILKECMALWREGRELTEDCRKKGREAEDFRKGKQWPEDVKRSIEALDRAALTINEVGPAIDMLKGFQMEQRTDLRFLPQEAGDQRVADMLNVVVKKVLDKCCYQREESKVFEDQVVPGFGCLNVYVDFLEDPEGNIIVERFPWDEIVYGPHDKEDLTDCEFEVRSRMQSIARLKQLFDEKADEIESNYKDYSGRYPSIDDSRDLGTSGTNADYRNAKKADALNYTLDGTLPLVDVQRKQFRFVQCTRKTYKKMSVLFNVDEEFYYPAYDWKQEDIAAAGTLPGFQVVTQNRTRMIITRFCGNVLLSHEDPADLPIHDFFTVPVYAYRQNGEYWGKVEAAKDPQRELNKRRSQLMDNVNRLGATVYYFDPETFYSPSDYESWKKNRSKPGSSHKVNTTDRVPYREEAAPIPDALVQIMQLDQENLQRLLNILPQQDGANESNALFLAKKKGKLTGNQFLFDNLSFAKQRLGKIIVALIQRYYTPERLERLLNSENSKSPFQVGGDDYSNFTPDEIIELLGTADLLDYDVIVAESSFNATTRLGIAELLLDAMAKGMPIPPELAFKFIDMPADLRLDITKGLEQQSQQAVQEATTTSNAEILKTLLAKGAYTVSPEKAAEIGAVPVNGGSTPPPQPAQDVPQGQAQQQLDANASGSLG